MGAATSITSGANLRTFGVDSWGMLLHFSGLGFFGENQKEELQFKERYALHQQRVLLMSEKF